MCKQVICLHVKVSTSTSHSETVGSKLGQSGLKIGIDMSTWCITSSRYPSLKTAILEATRHHNSYFQQCNISTYSGTRCLLQKKCICCNNVTNNNHHMSITLCILHQLVLILTTISWQFTMCRNFKITYFPVHHSTYLLNRHPKRIPASIIELLCAPEALSQCTCHEYLTLWHQH